MPSPSLIRRSSSLPRLSKTWSSQYTLPEDLPATNRSACSTATSKISTFRKKFGKLIIGRKRDSDLTEKTLEVHNKIQESIPVHNHVQQISTLEHYDYGRFQLHNHDEKYSPYYIRGLTHPSSSTEPRTPGQESRAPSAVSWTSVSTFFIKMRDWSSRIGSKSKVYSKKLKPSAYKWSGTPPAPIELSANSEGSTLVNEEIIMSSNENNIVEKPLRERVIGAAAPTNDPKVMEIDKKFVWADKHQPLCLEDFICNRDKATQLQALAREGGCGHFIFEGPPGVGRRTMIWAMLREAFGRDTINAREEFKAFNLKGEMVGSIEVHVKHSPQHVEVNLSELKGYEKHVIVELMKEAQTHNKISNKAIPCGLENCRAIILYEADKLSTDALLYIKWLLERYKGCNKVFFCCSDVSKLQAIRSLCTVVELLPPSKNELVEVLKFIAEQEGIDLPHELAEKFAENSKNNLGLAIRSFEATWKKSYPFKEDQVIFTGWEDNIADIAKNMIQEQSPKQLYIIRGKLQNLIVHGVAPEFIFKSLVEELKKHLDENLQYRIESMYDEYNIPEE